MKALLLVCATACTAAIARSDDPADDPKAAAGKQAFLIVHRVLLDPRCRNCHPAGDAPLQGAAGRPHAQAISRQSVRNGVPCATCHRTRNGTRPNTPPGAPNWRLPPVETPMVFEGRTPKQLCEQLKDPSQTGGKDLAGLIHHVESDPLVGWGWDPGPGRVPVSTPRDQVVAAMKHWVDAGAPCP